MIFPYCVKIDGVYYPANTEIRHTVVIPEVPQSGIDEFDGMTLKELKSYAKSHGISIKGLTDKDDILKAIRGA